MEKEVKKRGRPKLSEEEKLRRANLREKENKTIKKKTNAKKSGRKPKNANSGKDKIAALVDTKLKNIVVEEDDITNNDNMDYEQSSENEEQPSHLRRYTFVLNEDIRHSFGLKCYKDKYALPSAIVNELMRMFIDGEIQIRDDYDNYGHVNVNYDTNIIVDEQ